MFLHRRYSQLSQQLIERKQGMQSGKQYIEDLMEFESPWSCSVVLYSNKVFHKFVEMMVAEFRKPSWDSFVGSLCHLACSFLLNFYFCIYFHLSRSFCSCQCWTVRHKPLNHPKWLVILERLTFHIYIYLYPWFPSMWDICPRCQGMTSFYLNYSNLCVCLYLISY